MYTAIDCQGFAGGMTLGMSQAGFQLVGKREHKGGFGVANCEANRHLLGNAWEAQSGDAKTWDARPVDVVFGNPPCSGFSVASDARFRGPNSPINRCMWDFVQFAARCKPVIAAFESVRSAYSMGGELMTSLRQELEDLTGERYTLYHVMHNAYELGGAAWRPRYFWVASRVPFGVKWPNVVQHPTLQDVIGDLEHLPLTWDDQPHEYGSSWWTLDHGVHRRDHLVDGHMTARHNPHQARLNDLFKWSHEYGGWQQGETMHQVLKRMWQQDGFVPPAYEHDIDHMVQRDFIMGFISPKRWAYDKRATVIDGASLDRVIHPTLDRTITHREAARVMGFPDEWRIKPIKERSPSIPVMMATWGKGITVQCGRWLGQQIMAALAGAPGSDSGTLVAERQYIVKQNSKPVVSSDTNKQRSTKEHRVPKPRPDSVPARSTTEQEQHHMTETPQTEAQVAEKAAASGRGRGRPNTTKERDARVHAHMLAHPQDWTAKDLAAALGGDLEEKHVKACFDRLSWGDGSKAQPINPRVVRVNRSTWRAVNAAGTQLVQDEPAAPEVVEPVETVTIDVPADVADVVEAVVEAVVEQHAEAEAEAAAQVATENVPGPTSAVWQ